MDDPSNLIRLPFLRVDTFQMRPPKRSRVTTAHENLERRCVDHSRSTNDDPEYIFISGSSDDGDIPSQQHTRSSSHPPPETINLPFMSESEASCTDLSDSDGEILAQLDSSADENDWDPTFDPASFPIFISNPVSCLAMS